MQIGTLAGGVDVPTIIAGQSQAESYLLIGDAGTDLNLNSLEVSIDGIPFISISDNSLIRAFANWQQENDAALQGQMLKIATGQIRKNTTYRMVNDGVAALPIYAFSDGKDGVPVQATTKTINALSYETFTKFSALIVNIGAGNFATAEIVWADDHKSTVTVQELYGLYNLKFNGDITGTDTLTIDNTDQSIKSVQINTGANAVTVLNIKLPDASFQALKAGR